MQSFYSDRIICGNCRCHMQLVPPQGNLRLCKTNDAIINITENLCDDFKWSGETTPDGQLMRFPRDAQHQRAINA